MNPRPALLLALVLVAGCGGGGAAPSSHAASTGMQSGTLGLTFGSQAGTSSSTRQTKFVSPNAATAVIDINNGTPQNFDVSATSSLCQTANNTRTCAIPLTAPLGQDTIFVALKTAGGVTLGSGSNSVTVVAGTNFSLQVGINAVVAGVNSFSFSNGGSFQYGTASSITGTVVFADPSGAAITGSGNVPNFSQPITLMSSDPNVSFTTPGLTTPGQTFTVNYNGSAAVPSSVMITAMSGSTVVASGPVLLPGLVVTRHNLTTLALYGTIVPAQIVVGPDHNIWWAEQGTHDIGTLNPATGVITHYPSGLGSGPIGIAAGGDGNIWFSGGTTIGRMTTSGGVPGTGLPSYTVAGNLQQMTTDSQGNVWFVNLLNNQVGYFDNTFTPHEYTTNGTLGALGSITGLAVGADNAMYFTESGAGVRNIGRLTTPANGVAGTYTEVAVPNSSPTVFPWDIAAGPDGNLWFCEFANIGANQFFGKFAPAAAPTIVEYAGTFDPNAFANLVTITKGFDGNMWMAEGGGAVSIPPANPTMPVVQFFTDDGQTTMVKCVAGPDQTGSTTPGNIWCTAIGSPPLGMGFIATTDSILSWKPR